jgi:lipid-binding SYLF domain-containing protein
MPMGIHNPLPSSMACKCSLWFRNSVRISADTPPAECKKCGKILSSFVDPRQAFGPDKIIPPHVLANAKVHLLLLLPSSRQLSGRPKANRKQRDLLFLL